MVKDKKNIKDTMSIKISFMVYMKWTIVMLPASFKDLNWFNFFLATFFFFLSFSVGKRSILAKIWWKGWIISHII